MQCLLVQSYSKQSWCSSLDWDVYSWNIHLSLYSYENRYMDREQDWFNRSQWCAAVHLLLTLSDIFPIKTDQTPAAPVKALTRWFKVESLLCFKNEKEEVGISENVTDYYFELPPLIQSAHWLLNSGDSHWHHFIEPKQFLPRSTPSH